MVKACCVKECKSSWFPETTLSFFSFPINKQDLLKQWTENIQVKNNIGKYSTICSLHFKESDFVYCGPRRTLKKEAVPTSEFTDFIVEENVHDFTHNPLEYVFSKELEVVEENGVENDIKDFLKEEVAAPNELEIEENDIKIKIEPTEEIPTEAAEQEKTDYSQGQSEREDELRRQIKVLQSRLRRRDMKINKLCNIIKVLRKRKR